MHFGRASASEATVYATTPTEPGYPGVDHGMLRARATAIGPWEKFLISCGFPAECKF
jgi:hypothetical protein